MFLLTCSEKWAGEPPDRRHGGEYSGNRWRKMFSASSPTVLRMIYSVSPSRKNVLEAENGKPADNWRRKFSSLESEKCKKAPSGEPMENCRRNYGKVSDNRRRTLGEPPAAGAFFAAQMGGFSSDALEQSYLNWRQNASARLIRILLFITSASSFLRTLGHIPGAYALWTATILLCSTLTIIFQLVRPKKLVTFQIFALIVLICDVIFSLPTYESLFPAILATFAFYSFFTLPFYVILICATCCSVGQTCAFLLFVEPLHTNEILAIIVVHIWTNFTGIYLCSTADRLARNAFLSARNSAEAENCADFQSTRLNRLLSSFIPYHLITQARHQITLYKPHLYNETYSQVSVAYGRLIGFESVLTQYSRIDRLAAQNGCTRVASEGITVISSMPAIDSQHAARLCRFSLELETLICSFRDATGADVGICIGIDTGSITGGIVGTTKWHYDVIGTTVDNALLMQSNATDSGIYVSNETRRFLADATFELEKCEIGWRVYGTLPTPELFPVNKRFSLVTIPQAISRVLQSLVTMNPSTLKSQYGTCNKKRKTDGAGGGNGVGTGTGSKDTGNFDMQKEKSEHSSIISTFSQRFRNRGLEIEYHKETDHWFIPSLAISIFFLVVYGIYHMLVMPRLITSLALIVVALTLMFFILLMLYIDYFHSFSQFITRTSAGHSVTILLIITMLFFCGIVNTFSCPQPSALDVCQKAHFSTFSFALWTITTAVFVRFPSIYLGLILTIALITYALQIYVTRPTNFGAKEFMQELDLSCYLISLAVMVFIHARRCEKLLRLDFLAVVKGIEESATKDKLVTLNNQMLLNLVPAHVASGVVQKAGDVWHHSHQTVGIAYIAVSGFDLQGDAGLNGLNYVFSHFDQSISNFKGVEKVKSANRFYIVAVGLIPDSAQNVDETPWTIGELLSTLAKFLISISEFSIENEFHVQIGVDCGSTLAYVSNTDQPRYELFGETLDRSRILMQAAGHDTTLVSEEVYLALRPRPLRFGTQKYDVTNNLSAYELLTYIPNDNGLDDITLPRELQEKHTRGMVDAQFASNRIYENTQTSEMASSMASSFSSIDGDAETDSDLEWITPDTHLMNRSVPPPSLSSRGPPRKYVMRQSDYDPYREPMEFYSDTEGSRPSSRARGWRSTSRNSLRNGFGLFKRSSAPVSDTEDAVIEAAANRVDRMIQELNAYGDFADVKPLEYQPFPSNFGGSMRSVHRAMSSACHTEYDNAESDGDAMISDVESNANRSRSRSLRRGWRQKKRWHKDGADGDTESQCSSIAASIDLEPIRWKSVHSIGYENEYEMPSDTEGLAIEEMVALSRDIRNNFGDFQLSTFDDIDKD
ncbi:unnamed protein product [Caenorhabditis angaria]|uniref:adenylate cyclase n=1 Tax=Caenorhabditis angaria TaxID=860376 RepID=A0A9P1IIR8_9PELO|nr:unnamed protein product [Caenorhabditis angaria]